MSSPATLARNRLSHSAHWIASAFFDTDPTYFKITPIAIARKADLAVRWFHPPLGKMAYSLTISEPYLFVLLSPTNGANYGETLEVLRFDLARIEEFTSTEEPFKQE